MPSNASSNYRSPHAAVTVSTRATAGVAVLLALVVTLLGLAVVLAGPASAHDRLVSSDPQDGARLDEPPASITLTYSAEVLAAGTQVAVTGPDGEVAAGEPQIDGEVVTASLPADLPGGEYSVAWRAVSADGHPIEGTLGFDVAEQAAAPSPTPAASPSEAVAAQESPEASPSPTTGGQGASGLGSAAWRYLFALIAMVAVAAAAIARSRRRLGPGLGPDGQD